MGADIPRSTLIDWCGQAAAAIRPVANLIRAEVMAGDRLHADDTPIRVLDPKVKLAGRERGVKEGRVWVYVRDDRPWGGQDPPAAAYWFSPDRKGACRCRPKKSQKCQVKMSHFGDGVAQLAG